MAYILIVPKKGGVSIKGVGRIWYSGVDDNSRVDLSIVTDLEVSIESRLGFNDDYEPRHINVGQERLVRLSKDSRIHTEFLVEIKHDGNAKFVFFKTGPDGKTNYTNVVKGDGNALECVHN